MNEEFRNFIESLEPSFRRLMELDPVRVTALPSDMPKAGIYLFSDSGAHLYVGRSNTIRKRLQAHSRPGSRHTSAAFAFRLARKETGRLDASYTEDGSRSALEEDPKFQSEFRRAKERIRAMDVRYVSEPDPMRQALLEMYVAVSLRTPHNSFDNH